MYDGVTNRTGRAWRARSRRNLDRGFARRPQQRRGSRPGLRPLLPARRPRNRVSGAMSATQGVVFAAGARSALAASSRRLGVCGRRRPRVSPCRRSPWRAAPSVELRASVEGLVDAVCGVDALAACSRHATTPAAVAGDCARGRRGGRRTSSTTRRRRCRRQLLRRQFASSLSRRRRRRAARRTRTTRGGRLRDVSESSSTPAARKVHIRRRPAGRGPAAAQAESWTVVVVDSRRKLGGRSSERRRRAARHGSPTPGCGQKAGVRPVAAPFQIQPSHRINAPPRCLAAGDAQGAPPRATRADPSPDFVTRQSRTTRPMRTTASVAAKSKKIVQIRRRSSSRRSRRAPAPREHARGRDLLSALRRPGDRQTSTRHSLGGGTGRRRAPPVARASGPNFAGHHVVQARAKARASSARTPRWRASRRSVRQSRRTPVASAQHSASVGDGDEVHRLGGDAARRVRRSGRPSMKNTKGGALGQRHGSLRECRWRRSVDAGDQVARGPSAARKNGEMDADTARAARRSTRHPLLTRLAVGRPMPNASAHRRCA